MTEASINFHNVVSIKPHVSYFSNFTTHEWIATDKDGATVKVTFFHTHTDTLVIEPTIEHHYEPREKVNEDVTPTL